MTRKRIAILADFPWSYFDHGATGRGGGQACTWLTQLAEEFSGVSGCEFHWVSLDRSRPWGRTEHREWGGQLFHRIPAGKLSIDLALGYRPSKLRLLRELKRIRPGLVHCWGTERAYPVVCGVVSVPTILSMQGVISNLARMGWLPSSGVWKKMAAWEPRHLSRATVVTCESGWALERVREVVPSCDLRQVEYGVHPDFYQVTWEPEQHEPYALFVGSLALHKGVRILLETLKILDNRSWSLRLVGDGPLLDEIKACGLPNVECLGSLPWKDLQMEMKHASCLVHPTLADSSPNVVKEARVIGLPVITTVHGGQAGYIKDRENGLIVDPLEPAGLAAALESLMNDPELARTMGATRHDEDRTYFRPSETSRGFLALYDELLGDATKQP